MDKAPCSDAAAVSKVTVTGAYRELATCILNFVGEKEKPPPSPLKVIRL